MSDLQKEACTGSAMGRSYRAIELVFNDMPARFKLLDLMKAAKIKDSSMVRAAVSSVLWRDFKCTCVGPSNKREWKKP